MELEDIFDRHACDVVDVQFGLQKAIGKPEWRLNTETGIVRMKTKAGKRLQFQVQYLGTYADGDNSWIWAWQHPQLRKQKPRLRTANEVKRFGAANDIAMLKMGHFELPAGFLTRTTPWDLAHAAVAIVGKPAIACHHRGGSLFVILDDYDGRTRRLSPKELVRRYQASTGLMTYFKQREMLVGYCQKHGVACQSKKDKILVGEDGQYLVKFSKDGFLTGVTQSAG